MISTRTLVVAVLAAAALTACTDDTARTTTSAGTASGAPTPTPAAPTTTPTTSAPPASAPSSPLSASAGPTPAAPTRAGVPAFRADTRPDTAPARGGPLTVVAARAAAQPGYDRVVLQLAGEEAGEPGWRVEYVDRAVQDGSGRPVEVAGSAVLRVVVTGVGYPFDTGQTEATTDLTPKGTALVREVDLQATYEGSFTAFVGLTRRAPFRVFRLTDPARVVVDVRTG